MKTLTFLFLAVKVVGVIQYHYKQQRW